MNKGGVLDPEKIFKNEINEIEKNILKHIDSEIRIFFKMTPTQVKLMKSSEKRIMYIDILHHNKKQRESTEEK